VPLISDSDQCDAALPGPSTDSLDRPDSSSRAEVPPYLMQTEIGIVTGSFSMYSRSCLLVLRGYLADSYSVIEHSERSSKESDPWMGTFLYRHDQFIAFPERETASLREYVSERTIAVQDQSLWADSNARRPAHVKLSTSRIQTIRRRPSQ
jgi:hypothetical protein